MRFHGTVTGLVIVLATSTFARAQDAPPPVMRSLGPVDTSKTEYKVKVTTRDGRTFVSFPGLPVSPLSVDEPFAKLLARADGQTVGAFFGEGMVLTGITAHWAPAPFKPLDVRVSVRDGKLVADPNPYNGREVCAEELTVNGIALGETKAPPTEAGEPQAAPSRGAAGDSKAIVGALDRVANPARVKTGDSKADEKPTKPDAIAPVEFTLGDRDSIAKIAQRYGMTADQLLDLKGPNGLSNRDYLAKQLPGVERHRTNKNGKPYFLVHGGEKLFVPVAESITVKPQQPKTSALPPLGGDEPSKGTVHDDDDSWPWER